MFDKLYNKLINKMTANKTKIPLLFILFDHVKFKETGKIGSCSVKIHPVLNDDVILKEQINAMIDGIRERYDMDDMV
jgi:hypothetical protein